jgi:hypothetical protein
MRCYLHATLADFDKTCIVLGQALRHIRSGSIYNFSVSESCFRPCYKLLKKSQVKGRSVSLGILVYREYVHEVLCPQGALPGPRYVGIL